MKNIEKYKETKDAVKAWDAYQDGGGCMPFADWAEQEYIDTSVTTLLAAAKEAMMDRETIHGLRAENARLRAALKPVLDIEMDMYTSNLSMEIAINEAKRIYNEGEK